MIAYSGKIKDVFIGFVTDYRFPNINLDIKVDGHASLKYYLFGQTIFNYKRGLGSAIDTSIIFAIMDLLNINEVKQLKGKRIKFEVDSKGSKHEILRIGNEKGTEWFEVKDYFIQGGKK